MIYGRGTIDRVGLGIGIEFGHGGKSSGGGLGFHLAEDTC